MRHSTKKLAAFLPNKDISCEDHSHVENWLRNPEKKPECDVITTIFMQL